MKISTTTTLLFLYTLPAGMLKLITKENSFQLSRKHHLRTRSTAIEAQDSSFLCQHFCGIYWNAKSRLSKTVFKLTLPGIDDIFFPVGHKWTRHLSFLRTSSCLHLPTINSWRKFWHWDNVFRHGCIHTPVHRHKIQRKSCPGCKDTPFRKSWTSFAAFFSLDMKCEN